MSDEAPEHVISAEFWKSLTEAQFFVIARTGCLEGENLKKYWTFNKRTDPMPEKIQLYMRREDVQKLYEEMQLKRQMKH